MPTHLLIIRRRVPVLREVVRVMPEKDRSAFHTPSIADNGLDHRLLSGELSTHKSCVITVDIRARPRYS